MSKSSNVTVRTRSGLAPFYPIFGVLTAMIGYQIHHSVFWSIIDFFFWPIAWIKWLICHEVNLTIIKSAFSFFFA